MVSLQMSGSSQCISANPVIPLTGNDTRFGRRNPTLHVGPVIAPNLKQL